jgi:aspartate/methionine/tyrosine aminotransferase
MDLAWRTPDCLHLEVGEPDFGTPEHIREGGVRAIQEGKTRYTPNAGIPELRAALAEKIQRVNGYEVDAQQIVVSSGAVEAIYASLVTMLSPGDEILLPDPGWPNFRMMADLLSANIMYYPLRPENGFLPDPQEIADRITSKTRVLLVNFPSNPLGSVPTVGLLKELYEVAQAHDLWIVSDECYDQIVFDGTSPSPAIIDSDGRVISTYSFSKTYAMTGWRVGYAAVPPQVADILSKVQEPLISCVSGPAQYAALSALEGPQQCVTEMVDAYRSRRDAALAACNESGLTYLVPQGAFYLWLSIEHRDSLKFALDLVDRKKVAIAPGSAFGENGNGWLRISLANSADSVVKGVHAIAELRAES